MDFIVEFSCSVLYWKMELINIFFKYFLKFKLVFFGVEFRNFMIICIGFIIWCLFSGVIKIRSGEKMVVKEFVNLLLVYRGGLRFLFGRLGNVFNV